MKISVVTVAFKAAATIADTLRSVAAQTHPDIEHIIIDGGPDDGTPALVAQHARPGTVYVREADQGLYDAMNKGLARASGELVGFLNADDFYCRTDAARLLAAAAKNADAVSGGVAIVRANDVHRLVRAYPAQPFAPWMLRFAHMPPHPGFYVRRGVFEALGGFDPRIRIGADFEWMVRFFRVHSRRAVAIPETLVTLRDGGLSNSGLASRRAISREAVASLRRHGISTGAPLVWAKYPVKALQFAARPHQWPAPAAVRWEP